VPDCDNSSGKCTASPVSIPGPVCIIMWYVALVAARVGG